MSATISSLRDAALLAVSRLKAAGFTAYWAGGCVRDILLQRDPKDYDVATNATPDEILGIFPHASLAGKQFGVIRAGFQNFTVEIATFRQDIGYGDGRHPDRVAFTDARSDAERRDFTINAMFYDPVAGILHDFVGGEADLKAHLVRCVGNADQRFHEDYLRMLRAVRFASMLDFALAPDAETAISGNASLIRQTSPERIRDELLKILTEAVKPGNAVMLLNRLHLLAYVLPEVADLRNYKCADLSQSDRDVLATTAEMLNMTDARSAREVLSILFHAVGLSGTAQVTPSYYPYGVCAARGAELARAALSRLKAPKRDIEFVAHCVSNQERMAEASNMDLASLKKMVGAPTFQAEMELHRVMSLATGAHTTNHEFLAMFAKSRQGSCTLPPAWVSGADIMALGLPPGPEIGRLARMAYDAQLSEKYASKKAVLEWLRQVIDGAR